MPLASLESASAGAASDALQLLQLSAAAKLDSAAAAASHASVSPSLASFLPLDPLSVIISYLPSLSDVSLSARVSRHWLRCFSSSSRGATQCVATTTANEHKMKRFAKFAAQSPLRRHVSALSIHASDADSGSDFKRRALCKTLAPLLAQLSQLRTLELCDSFTGLTWATLDLAPLVGLTHFAHLIILGNLEWSREQLEAVKRMPALRTLHRNGSSESPPVHDQFRNRWTKQELTFLSAEPHSLQNLRSLGLFDRVDGTLMRRLHSFSALENFEAKHLTVEAALLLSPFKLKELRLHWANPSVEEEDQLRQSARLLLPALASCGATLESLDMEDFQGSHEDCLVFFSAIPRLRTLILRQSHVASLECLLPLRQSLTALDCRSVVGADFAAVSSLSCMASLRYLKWACSKRSHWSGPQPDEWTAEQRVSLQPPSQILPNITHFQYFCDGAYEDGEDGEDDSDRDEE